MPHLYGAQDALAAASETVFHTVPAPDGPDLRPRAVLLPRYTSWMWSTITPSRDLTLLDLREPALRRLGSSRNQLVLCDERHYPVTRRWAEAAYNARPQADGLWWHSRQAEQRDALVLFGQRRGSEHGVDRKDDLEILQPPVPMLGTEGLERLAQVANDLDIDLLWA